MRDHIEFVQAQRLPWRDGGEFGLPGRQLKLLSRDAQTGAFSCILRFPEGWLEPDRALPVDVELYVLDGCIRLSGVDYAEDGYAFLPAGFACAGAGTPSGATVLTFFSGAFAGEARTRFDEGRLVRKVDLADGVWDGAFDRFGLASMNDRARMRVLRDDPLTGENTYITATVPFRHGERAERHPVVQEFFVLAGELAGNTGTMQAGAYCFRPEMIAHGPYGSRTGALILFRSLGGAQATFWQDAPPFTFTPRHGPVLPASLAGFGDPLARPPRY
ncbi:MAG: cupin domain-containing protein [Acidisphaera sp.]|nr:cupin domain-containing protein [Acidisphaera sp.]